MPRKAQGTAFAAYGGLHASVTVAPRKRMARSLEGIVPANDEALAREWAGALQALVDGLRVAGRSSEIEARIEQALKIGRDDPSHGLERVRRASGKLRAERGEIALVASTSSSNTTFKAFAMKWVKGKLHLEYPDYIPRKKTADKDKGLLENHVFDVMGSLSLDAVTLEHGQDVLRRLPRERSTAMRRQVAQVMYRVMNLAVFPCKLIKTSPFPRGFLPKVKVRVGAYLYPSDEKKLLSCKDVPVANRILYGFLAREGMRSSEALLLEWTDLDLENGGVRLDENKTDDPRAWALDRGTVAALKWWKKNAPADAAGKRVFEDMVDSGHLADELRGHLQVAKITRPELYEHNDKRRRMNVHGLRSTFVTIALANGKSETWVQDRTGHRSSLMVNRYRRVARTVAELHLGPLAPFDKAIPEMQKTTKKRAA
jgi:integrase